MPCGSAQLLTRRPAARDAAPGRASILLPCAAPERGLLLLQVAAWPVVVMTVLISGVLPGPPAQVAMVRATAAVPAVLRGILSQKQTVVIAFACLPSLCSCRACPALHTGGQGGGHGAPAPELLWLGGCHPGRWATFAAALPATSSYRATGLIQAHMPVFCSLHDDCAAGKAGIQAGIWQLAVRTQRKADHPYTSSTQSDQNLATWHRLARCACCGAGRWVLGCAVNAPTAAFIAQFSLLPDVLHVAVPT